MSTKWASLYDLTNPISKEVIDEANKQAWRYVFDAANWEIEQSSTTSGMYGSWYVKISMNTTVKDLRVVNKLPTGVGGSLEDAFIDFTQKMEKFNNENGF
jgi:hypothetical protein